MFCLTWRYNWNTAVISNGSAQLELKMEKNTRFFRVSRLETQAHRCLVPGGTKSIYGLFMWPREKLDITVMEEGNLTNNNVVEYTLLSRSVLTASFSRKKKKGAVTQGNPSTESNAIPCTQDTIKVITQTKWIKQSPNTTVFTNFCFWSHPVWKSWGRELQECSAWGDI